jgi:hypothetical protein
MTDLEIREQIAAYVAGDIVSQELEDRLEDAAWDLDVEPQRTWVGTVLRLLAERSHGDWTDAELRDQIGALNRIYWFENAPKNVIADSIARIIRRDQRSVATDRPLVAESA